MDWIWKLGLSLILSGFVLQACNNGNTTPRREAEVEKEERAIFHQEKALSLGDSLHIRVLSWGGVEIGNYLVLLADSAGGHYVGSSFVRNGQLQNAWVDDLDKDGLPEVGVIVQKQDGRKYGSLRLHELTKGFDYQTIILPPLSETLGADYGGYDSLYRGSEGIIREFSLLDGTDTMAENSGRRRILYHVENNQLVVGKSEELMPQE